MKIIARSILAFGAAVALTASSSHAAQVQIKPQKKIPELTVQPKIDITYEPASPSNRDKIVFTAVPNDPSVVHKVEFMVKARKVGEALAAPWTFTGGPYAAGVITVGAVSYDAAGKTLASKYTAVRITEAPLDLTFKISPPHPTNRDAITIKAVIPVQRNIRSMAFALDGARIGEDKVYPWEFKGGPYPAKRYSLGVYAYDLSGSLVGRKFTSLEVKFYPVELTVSHSPQKPTAADMITFTAEASDTRDIAAVEFFVSARSVGKVSALPWKVTAGPFPKGQITYGFIIYDKAGRPQGSKYSSCRID